MHLRSVSLRDWKAFEDARFDFPAPDGNRNVILIGGENGFGKTTLFEAIVFGLFGRDGLPLVSRAAAKNDESGRIQSYRDFMERALNGRAIQRGHTSCRIELTFEDDSGSPIVIQRKWNFSNAGRLRGGEDAEEVSIVTGIGRKTEGPARNDPDPVAWYRDWLSRVFLPTHLAGFFVFDGESASDYANRDMGQQVREGIEGMLGLTWLRELERALGDYYNKRLGEVPKGANSAAITALQTEVASLETEILASEAERDGMVHDLTSLESEQTSLTRELASYGTGTRAELEDLISARERDARAFSDAEQRLREIAALDFPLALAGSPLRQAVDVRLRGEAVRESWLAARAQGQSRVSDVLRTVTDRLPEVTPPLIPPQALAIEEAVRAALEQLWNPAPTEATSDSRHTHATGALNDRVRQRLNEAARLTSATISDLLTRMEVAARSVRTLDDAIKATQTAAPDLEEKKQKLLDLGARIGSLRERRGALGNLIESRKPQLVQKRAELGRLTEAIDSAERPARLAKRASQVMGMLNDLISDAWPMQANEVSVAMTEAVQAMAHRRNLLHRVEITREASVKLLTPDGRDLRDFDLAAGEKQIFTQALFSAIAKVSGRVFPLMIDTPLGRLDEEHRLNVLRHITNRDSQVILISTNTEVVGQYLDAIRPRILKAYKIKNQTDGNIGRSHAVEGYFSGQGL
jgi:DNA sulfur modification protein DndD